jgi:hypothetical protein
MNNLLFYALLIALLYYFLVYLPSQKLRPDPQPTNSEQSTQTEPEPSVNLPGPTYTTEDITALEKTLDQMIKGMDQLSKEIK